MMVGPRRDDAVALRSAVGQHGLYATERGVCAYSQPTWEAAQKWQARTFSRVELMESRSAWLNSGRIAISHLVRARVQCAKGEKMKEGEKPSGGSSRQDPNGRDDIYP